MVNKFPKINFIGNKEKLAKIICDNIPHKALTFFDTFSGGGSVGFEAKKRGFKVITNDIMKINYLISHALIENSKVVLESEDLETLFSGKPVQGYMFKNYRNKLFFPEECMELDQYGDNVNKLKNKYKKSLALILLRRAMIRKMPYSRFNLEWDKITQLRDENYSYRKYKRKRAYHNLEIKRHILDNISSYNNAVFDNGKENRALNKNVFDAIEEVDADVAYLDPPYTGTMNNYFDFYGPLDELIENRKLEPFRDNFIDRKKALFLFDKLFSRLAKYRYWILSYNNKSYPSEEELINIIKKYSSDVRVIEMGHVYKLTGKENKKKNIELLFIMKNNLFEKKDKKNIVLKHERLDGYVIDSLDLRQQRFSFGDN